MSQLGLLGAAGSAVFSPCGRYRYELRRNLAAGLSFTGEHPPRTVAWLMLNPSTASAEENDPTMRKVLGFSSRWKFDLAVVVNLWALVSTEPRGLLDVADPIGPDNDRHILAAAERAEIIVCAWGANVGELFPVRGVRYHDGLRITRACLERREAVVAMLQLYAGKLRALTRTSSGEPGHPLMLSYKFPPRPYP